MCLIFINVKYNEKDSYNKEYCQSYYKKNLMPFSMGLKLQKIIIILKVE